jgi:hypothetical protein
MCTAIGTCYTFKLTGCWPIRIELQFHPDPGSSRNEYQEYFPGGGGRRPVRRADKLATFMCRLS